MPYYSILAVTRHKDDWLSGYQQAADAAIARHGGRVLARTHDHEQLEGAPEGVGTRVILRWPNREAALNFMNDPEYLPHLQGRLAGATCTHFLVPGTDDLA